jgi:hypothetical protein
MGVGLSWFSNRWQWNRQQSVRWHDDRRRAYCEFLAAGDAYEEAVCALASTKPSDPWGVHSTELDTAYEALRAAMTQLTMFASLKVGMWASTCSATGPCLRRTERWPFVRALRLGSCGAQSDRHE